MNYLNELKNKHIIVLGLGISGLSTLRFFARHNIPCDVVDSRDNPPNADSAIELARSHHFGALSKGLFTHADLIVISPGIPLATSEIQHALANGIEVVGDIELFARLNNKPVYAVTGSNGKSSVVTLAADVLTKAGLKVALAGNIGTPVLDVVEHNVDCYVLELSSFQLETTKSLNCEASCVLNISADHMDRYDTLVEYAHAKQRIHNNSKLIIVNHDDQLTASDKHPQLTFAANQADYYIEKGHFCYQHQPLLATNTLSVIGTHNQLNALSVMALLHNLSLPIAVFNQAFSAFFGLAHRCQLVTTHNHVSYINDSKATNVGATQAALSSLAEGKNIILIAGGVGKGADFSELKSDLDNSVKQLIAFGQDKAQLALLTPNSAQVNDLNEAVLLAKHLAVPGDIVLFAPACASFDMFQNFEHRGETFAKIVKQMVTI
jgi:UDP-N-acetylmuramoylalanine--D-glutamate ligase